LLKKLLNKPSIQERIPSSSHPPPVHSLDDSALVADISSANVPDPKAILVELMEATKK
jgi:hypothetical protein